MSNLTANTTWGNNLSIKTSKHLYPEFAFNLRNIEQLTPGNTRGGAPMKNKPFLLRP